MVYYLIIFGHFLNNGVKEGGVLSSVIFSVYIDGLFDSFRIANGCYVGTFLLGHYFLPFLCTYLFSCFSILFHSTRI